MKTYLGVDFSTQSASALLINADSGEQLWENSIPFSSLDQFKTENGVVKGANGEVTSPPLMWITALDQLMQSLADSGQDLKAIQAISGSGQQHGSVCLKSKLSDAMQTLNPKQVLTDQLQNIFSRSVAPIWMDTSTGEECETLQEAFPNMADITGSPATLRFTGPQIAKFYKQDPDAYQSTSIIHLVSSFMASLFLGQDAAIDVSDGSGMNLLDLKTLQWHSGICEKTAPGLESKLLPAVASNTILGKLSNYWVERFGFNPDTKIIAFSGDNPCSLVGLGLSHSEHAAISLGTSDTFFGLSQEANISSQGEGHVFASPTQGYMSLICFINGSLAREKVREQFNLSWEEYDQEVASLSPAQGAHIMLPYFAEEITPASKRPQVYRYGLSEDAKAENCRAIFEAQMLSMRLHSQDIASPKIIHATGGASNNEQLCQIMANVFNANIKRLKTPAGASLGAALRALEADQQCPWDSITERFLQFDEKEFTPDPIAHSRYTDLLEIYRACEQHALFGGKDPEPLRQQYLSRWT